MIFPAKGVSASQPYTAHIDILKRRHAGFEPTEKKIGGFFIAPMVRMAQQYDDNIYAHHRTKQSDWITTVQPTVSIRTDRGYRTGMRATLFTHHGFYTRQSNENFHDHGIDINPYTRWNKNTSLKARFSWKNLHEMRTDEGGAFHRDGQQPVRYRQSTARIGWHYKPSRAQFICAVQSRYYDYENVGNFDGTDILIHDDRNRFEHAATVHMRYAFNPMTKIYWHNKIFYNDYERRDYNYVADQYNGFNRDSSGLQSIIGMRFLISPLIHARIHTGVHKREFNDIRFGSLTTPIGEAGITWGMTPLVTFYADAERQVYETRNRNASTYVQNQFRLKAAYEVKRDIVIETSYSNGSNHYTDDTRRDDFESIEFAATYAMNRHISWRGSYAADTRDSSVANGDFKRNRIFISAQVRF